MKAIIKRIHSPDVFDFTSYKPDDPQNFGFLLQLMMGTEEVEGADSFDVVVCSPAHPALGSFMTANLTNLGG
jgi:hypothetical protein